MILLSFDTEEFDVPREHGVDFSLEDGMKVSVYGIPKSLFKDKFGKTFGSKEFLNYKDTLKKNNYKSCDLLFSFRIPAVILIFI